jgi:dipeptidyl aminopeptidase/acylaminoacyl peptidase
MPLLRRGIMADLRFRAGCLPAIREIGDFCFSGDDRQIFYATNLGERFEIWAINSGGGYPRLVSLLDEGDVKALEVSPDGEWIAFVADVSGLEEFRLYVMPSSGGIPVRLGRDLSIPFPAFTWSPCSRSLALVALREDTHNVAQVDAATGEARWITDTRDLKTGVHWSPDGDWIAYTSLTRPLRSDICLLSVRDGSIRNLTGMLEGENTGAFFSPDGKSVAFTSDARGIKNVLIMNVEARSACWMNQKDNEQTFLRWNCRGDRFAFLVNHEAELAIMESDFPPTGACRLVPPGYVGSHVRFGNKTGQVAMKISSATQPPELFVKKDRGIRKLTESLPHGLSPGGFTAPEKIRYLSFDHREIPALYYKPQGVTGYPVIVWIHGGPTGQHFDGWSTFIQLFVSSGFAVLAPNVRGSTGYGKEFENLNFRDWGGGDLKDVVAGMEFVYSDENADPEKVIVGGGSYGGYLAMMAAARHPDLWRAGINWMGPINLKTLYETSSPWRKGILEKKFGFKPPEEDLAFYKSRSPLSFAENVKCPILLIYGKNDPRVPITEMEQLREKLRQAGKTFQEEVLEGEGHGLSRPAARLSVYGTMIDFISRHVNTG